ncbi:unnamed protein product [Cuscuta campestris]|uniref:Uncharacterized protein n=1 Tax=Cuscuta campestris TaxID=132261 RepID=A0A484M1Q9_9ASTE|nr:unnamed protein product [Cuscuta campestris]
MFVEEGLKFVGQNSGVDLAHEGGEGNWTVVIKAFKALLFSFRWNKTMWPEIEFPPPTFINRPFFLLHAQDKL